MKTKEIRELYNLNFKPLPEGSIISNDRLDELKIYNDRLRYLLSRKRKGDVRLISEITGLQQQYIDRSFTRVSHRHHTIVIDLLDDIVSNREAIKNQHRTDNKE